MPRKKKTKPTNTYFKAKNGRFYKKVQIDGKTRVRFVTNAEATGAMSVKPKRTRKVKAVKVKQEPKEPEADAPDEKQDS